MSILIFLAVLFVLVLVHELGHFVVAKWTGMRVDEFGIGFPPKLFGIKKGETEYTINALPIGGFVKIFGEDSVGTESSPVPSEARDHRSEALAEAGEGRAGTQPARLDENLSERSDGESPASGQSRYGKGGEDGVENRSFTSRSKWAQIAVLLAGVTMNVLFAWLLVAIAFGIGVQTSVSETEATENARLTITSVLPQSPADEALLSPGSVIKGVHAGNENLDTLSPSAFSAFIERHADTPVTIAYLLNGELRAVAVTPKTGIIEGNATKPAIGVALSQIDILKRSVTDSITDSFVYILTGLHDITIGLGSLLYDTVRMKADFSQVAGPVGIVGLVGEASAFGLTSLLMFTAFISLNLAVINVLPFPALDGGRLVLVIVEAVKGSPIPPKYVATVNAVGFFILIALMVAVTWNDVARLI